MFIATYKTTMKTLLRSILLWIAFALVIFIAMNGAIRDNFYVTLLDDDLNIIGYMTDTDPNYILTFDKYIQVLQNSTQGWIMCYAVPIFCIVSSMIVLNRDYGDGFFEIEKSSGISILTRFCAKYSALITLNSVFCLVPTFLSIHYYYFSRGGLDNFTLYSYVCDSTVRVMRIFCSTMLPAMLCFIGVVVAIGSLSKSSYLGVCSGMGFVVIEYLSKYSLRMKIPSWYHDYLSPNPTKSYQYWTFYDTEWFNEKTFHNPFTNSQMVLSLMTSVIIALLLFAVSYISTQKRSI